MKVGLVNNAWVRTGVGRYTFEIFSEFKKMKKYVDMIYLQNRIPPGFRSPSIKILSTPFKIPIGMATFNNFFYFPTKIPKGYDVYHISNETIGRCCKYLANSVITCHDMILYYLSENYDWMTSSFIKKHTTYFEYAKRIIVTTTDTKDDIIKFLKVPEEKIKVVHIAPSKIFRKRNRSFARKKLHLSEENKIILHVGKDLKGKNIATLLRAVHKVKKGIKDFKLIRIGGATKETSNLIKKLDLENEILFTESLPDRKMALFYNAADVYVYPAYISEGCPLTAVEAMASGAPVIASATKSIQEIVGSVGMLIDPFDDDGFAKAICEILTDDNLKKSMEKKSLKRSKNFSWKKCAKETWKIYEEASEI